jgi:UDP-N-acetylmuramate dehydrogenase
MDQTFYQELLRENPRLAVLPEEPMKNHTTFHVGGPAEYYAEPEEEELKSICRLARTHGIKLTVIGNGSNLLVRDGGIRGMVVAIAKNMSDIRVSGDHIYAQAGALLSKVANTAAISSLTGMEFAAGIPGSVGGAIVMNAGAYGGEIKDILVSATLLAPDGTIRTVGAEELDLSYRHSCIPGTGEIVLGAEFALKKGETAAIRETMAELRERRSEKQPLEFYSAGSTFKRPVGYFAGKLIMDAGLRGYRVGDAQVSEKHCGFVINRGNATAAQILQLIEDVRAKVFAEFQVELEPEIRILGD